jgi:hypothetical protein
LAVLAFAGMVSTSSSYRDSALRGLAFDPI